MFLTIILRKEVPDQPAGQALLEIVTQKLAEYPDVKVSGSVSAPLEADENYP